MRNINNILRRNQSVIEELNPSGKTKTTRNKMDLKGFDFEYHTRTYQTQNGKSYRFFYEYGYLPLDGDEVLPVKREDKID